MNSHYDLGHPSTLYVKINRNSEAVTSQSKILVDMTIPCQAAGAVSTSALLCLYQCSTLSLSLEQPEHHHDDDDDDLSLIHI